MVVDVNTKAVCKVDIDAAEAFRILCKTLYMDFVLNEDIDFCVKKDVNRELAVYNKYSPYEKCYDSRGKLFIALRNVAVELFPDVSFRNDDYIYKDKE